MPSTETVVAIEGDKFFLNGEVTHQGRHWRDHGIEGMLFNSRMANTISDDENPATRGVWAYADGPFSAERNTGEFVEQLPAYRSHGLDAVCLNLQGGSPEGYSWIQPWHISGFEADGTLKQPWLDRLDQVITACDGLGMVVILGLFYWQQTRIFRDEEAVRAAVANTADWLVSRGARNVLLEIGNEINAPFAFDIIMADRCHELIELVQNRTRGKLETPAGRLLVSTSLISASTFGANLLRTADFILPHGNRRHHPDGIRLDVLRIRTNEHYRGQPIIYNEDDHFDFDQPDNNFVAAIGSGASWGFFDYRMDREKYPDGYQSLPVDWSISSPRKIAFFNLLKEITGR